MRENLRLLGRQFTSPIILILLVATALSIALGERIDGYIILAIIIPSGLLGFYQERRAGKTMEALLKRVEVMVEIIRGGQEIQVPASKVEVDDVLLLSAGAIIPGEAITIESNGLLVDESILTGESFSIEKSPHEILLAGTHVVSGSATARVTKVGTQTTLGQIEQDLAGSDVTTGFEKGIIAFGVLLMKAMLVLVFAVLAFNIVLHRPILDSFLFSLALAVGLTPQLLPVIITASLSTGARKMAQKKVLVKRLDAIEDFGVVDVLCTDKTGTLTSGVISLSAAIDINGENSEKLRRYAYLNAFFQKGFANPIDQAIIESSKEISNTPKLLGEIPYDFERRRLTIIVDENGPLAITKGAFESVMSVSDRSNEVFWRQQFEKLSMQGNRVLALAIKPVAPKLEYSISDESELQILGLLAFMDSPKPGAAESIEVIKALNIETYLITGDNPLAARSIGAEVGISAEKCLTGKEMSELSDTELVQAIKGVHIYAEINPLQKERLVKALQRSGKTVAYFGDGINDAPALKAADVGISVDTAVDVAKNAASVVLLDKDLTVIADGVVLGRKTFVNTMKYVRVGISAAFGNVLSMAIAAVFLPYLPMLPMQILLLNFLTDFPAIMIAGDRVDEEILKNPRKWDIANIRKLMIIFGLVSTIFDLATFALLRFVFDADEKLFHSGWFVESALTELVVMMVLRTHRKFWLSKPGRGLFISSWVVAIIIISLPFSVLGATLGFVALPTLLVASILGLIAIYIVLNELLKNRWWN